MIKVDELFGDMSQYAKSLEVVESPPVQNIKTEGGVANPLPLSDIQENNNLMENKFLKELIRQQEKTRTSNICFQSMTIFLIIAVVIGIYYFFKNTHVLYEFARTIAGFMK